MNIDLSTIFKGEFVMKKNMILSAMLCTGVSLYALSANAEICIDMMLMEN